MKTKLELDAEIKALQTRRDALHHEGINYNPSSYTKCFHIDIIGTVYENQGFRINRFQASVVGNAYPTEEATKRIIISRQILIDLREYAFLPDWKDPNQKKWNFNLDGDAVTISYSVFDNEGQPVWFESKELAQAAMDKVSVGAVRHMLVWGLV